MKNKLPKFLVNRLKEARRAATMEQAGFGFSTDTLVVAGKTVGVTEFIKESTRVYRETWIIPQIDEVLAWAKS